jgi:hypothetical protein
MYYLNSFEPLCCNKQGRLAIKKYNLPPFVDASCRREPDLQSAFPSISAVCRGRMFAPKLQEGDSVIYMTVKGSYGSVRLPHWRLISVLRVVKRFESHKEASEWYQGRGIPLPSNCLVKGNACLPYDMTNGGDKELRDIADIDERLRRWDLGYQKRTRRNGVFLACEAEFLELNQPPILTRETLLQIFGRIPPTRTPPPISEREYAALRNIAFNSKTPPTQV